MDFKSEAKGLGEPVHGEVSQVADIDWQGRRGWSRRGRTGKDSARKCVAWQAIPERGTSEPFGGRGRAGLGGVRPEIAWTGRQGSERREAALRGLVRRGLAGTVRQVSVGVARQATLGLARLGSVRKGSDGSGLAGTVFIWEGRDRFRDCW